MTDPLVGQFIDEFELLERIGGSRAGELYRARQTSLDRIVALKLLPEAASHDPSQVARFRQEADAAAAVSHPNIIEIHAVGCQGGRHYFAMEFVAGDSLAAILERDGRLPADQALALMRQVADALASVHAAGILHCDIQPSNILVARGGRAKLTGFGLARRGDDARPAGGAPLYCPPEAARGKRLDQRSDLYLLGATFYHAIAGRPPFEADSAEELALLHARGEVPRIDEFVPTAPVALCRTIHRLLRRKPGGRYQSAEEVLEALDRVEGAFGKSRTDTPRPRRGPAPPSRAERRESRRRGRPPDPRTPAERAQEMKEREKQVVLLSAVALLVVLIVVILLFVAF